MRDTNSYIGKQIGNYRLVAEVDRGTYGTVYTAKLVVFTDEPIVALKLFHADLNAQERKQCIQEAQILRKLKHPHILRLIEAGVHIDAGRNEELLYLVTEYAPHGSLRELLKKRFPPPLSQEEAVTILSQVAQALQYAHQQEKPVVHRDLKPENILFNAQGNALLADFSIAAILDAAKTKNVGFGGSLFYMAPEQFEYLASPKSDQYALGCIAYELLTGKKPFVVPEPNVANMWYQHAMVEPVALTQHNPHLPTHIVYAVLKAMEKQRINRYADVSTFITALCKSPQQWMEEGLAHYRAGRREEALVIFEQVTSLDSSIADAHRFKSYLLNDSGRYYEALASLEQAVQLGVSKDSLLHACLEHFDAGRYHEALAACEAVIRFGVHRVALHRKGRILSALKRYEEALEAFRQAIDLDPNDESYFEQGNVLLALERFEAALDAFEWAILLNPSKKEVFLKKSQVLKMLGRSKEADEAYNQAKVIEAEEDEKERTGDLGLELLKKRAIALGTPIDDDDANNTIASLLYLQNQDAKTDIKLYIDSLGGSIYASLAIYDIMQWLKPDISTVCIGEAAGMGAILLAAGAKGKRFALPTSTITLVPTTCKAEESETEIEKTARELLRLTSSLYTILASHTGQPRERIMRDMNRTLQLTAEDAVSYGIIDGILTPSHPSPEGNEMESES